MLEHLFLPHVGIDITVKPPERKPATARKPKPLQQQQRPMESFSASHRAAFEADF